MLASFLLALREGLEAALIISLLLGTLRKLDYRTADRNIWLGTGAALLVSVLAGLLLNLLGTRFSGRAEEIFEGASRLLAAGILTWVILWMGRRSHRLNDQMKADLKFAVERGGGWALFSLAFLAVIREGVELALFLTAAAFNADSRGILWGAALGLAVVILISILFFGGLIRLDLKRFFQITSLILILFAAGLIAQGVGEFTEAGLIPPLTEHLYDINFILDESSSLGLLLKALLGYNGNPSLTEVAAYLFYLAGTGIMGFKVFRGDQIPKGD
jgi:high-affinity iron transporter